jgi:hypothetical protein
MRVVCFGVLPFTNLQTCGDPDAEHTNVYDGHSDCSPDHELLPSLSVVNDDSYPIDDDLKQELGLHNPYQHCIESVWRDLIARRAVTYVGT